MQQHSKKFQELKNKYIAENAKKEALDAEILTNKVAVAELDNDIEKCDKAILLLTNVSLEAKESVVVFLEEVVTDALHFVGKGEYTFKIKIDDKGKTTKCDFFLVKEVNGELSYQDPKDANGGGLVDLVSSTLRYAYLNIYKNPKLAGPIILDEPGKMVSEGMSLKFGEFIKKIGEEFNRQTIMVTHKDNITYSADNSYHIS